MGRAPLAGGQGPQADLGRAMAGREDALFVGGCASYGKVPWLGWEEGA